MTVSIEQPPGLTSDRFSQRVTQLGLALLRINARGSSRALIETGWFEQKLLTWPGFSQILESRWLAIATGTGNVIELFPGASLVPLGSSRRKRLHREAGGQSQLAVLLLSPAIVNCEQVHHLCSFHQLDHAQTVERISRGNLIDPQEATRLAQFIVWMHQDAREVERQTSEIQLMGQELAESYEELSLLYKLSTNMTVNQSPKAFLEDACHELRQVLEMKWLGLQLTDKEKRLEFLAGEIILDGGLERHGEMRKIGRKLLHRFGNADEPVVVDDTSTLNMQEIAGLASSLLIVPLHLQGKPLGILFAGDKLNQTQISSVDSKLCDSLCNSLTIFLDNMMLYKDMHAMFLGTLHALTSAIDAKDSYTHGHSERVAMVSHMLAEAAGLDQQTCERVYVAGLVHDVGKIGVPEAVLGKPGHLTEEEFQLIRRHPEIGGRILEDIHQMRDLIPGVLHHHERWDGTGYPHKLAGENIPLFGRLIALADAFDAMSSNRTYRQSMSDHQVLDEIRQCAGMQFDPGLAQTFLKLDLTPLNELTGKRKFSEKNP